MPQLNTIKSKKAILTLIIVAISGCASQSAPKLISEINANRDDYLRKNFNATNLPPKILQSLPSNNPLPFHLITIQEKVEAKDKDKDGKKTLIGSTTKIYNIGGGLTQSVQVTSLNDIPVKYNFDTSYRNTYLLSHQSAIPSKKYANPIVRAKEIKKIDAFPEKIGERSTYIFDVVMVSTFNGNTYTNKSECKTDKYYPGSTLNKNIEGLAINMQCGNYLNTSLSGFDNWIYLEKYGISIHSGKKDTGGEVIKTLQSFVVE